MCISRTALEIKWLRNVATFPSEQTPLRSLCLIPLRANLATFTLLDAPQSKLRYVHFARSPLRANPATFTLLDSPQSKLRYIHFVDPRQSKPRYVYLLSWPVPGLLLACSWRALAPSKKATILCGPRWAQVAKTGTIKIGANPATFTC